MRRALVIAAVLAAAPAVVAPTVARADAQAEAVALFDQGIRDMKAGKFDTACKAFAKSLALVQDSGTKGSLAKCYEKTNKLASAWLLWRELADTAPTPDLRKDAGANAQKLEAKVAKYVVKLTAPTPNLTVTVNGKQVDASIEVAVPVDAGPVAVVATSPHHFDWTTNQTATNGETLTIEIPGLEEMRTQKGATEPVIPIKPPVDEAAAKRGTRRTIGFTTMAFGGAALAGGVVFGVITRSRFDEAKTLCGGDIDHCNPDQVGTAQGKVDEARKAGTISTILFAGGAALAAVGIVVVLTAPSAEKRVTVSPTVTPQSAGVALTATF